MSEGSQVWNRLVCPPKRLLSRLWVIQVYDALLPVVITLHSFTEGRKPALGLLVIWMSIRLVNKLVPQFRQPPWRPPLEAILLALLLVNTRVIVLREDVDGPTNFLLIALGFVIGSSQGLREWRASFGWLALTPLLLAINILNRHSAASILSSSFVKDVYEAVMDGHGGINRFATILMLVTLSAAAFSLLARSLSGRVFGTTAALAGYALCVGTDSRLAQIAPPLALVIGMAAARWKKGFTRFVLFLFGAAATAALLVGSWWFLFAPDASINQSSDLGRLRAGACWLSLMFTGNNRFIYGVGYGAKANEMCSHLREGGGFGHAHNTIAQVGGQLGLLGILAFLIVVIVISMGLRRQALSVACPSGQPRFHLAFFQAAVSLNVLLLLNALATTIYRSNQVTQCLIGFLAATSLCLFTTPAATTLAAEPPPAALESSSLGGR
ncbi:O-antigen ligase family protein [Synechococcus sp. ATX 2A4]|uniref:O-antigen ligase family protein n=1 Tax=Synechococcus sp. ATX 2A4 TaxID=2823727 RepID=UPI0020CEAAE5|nr:O-antigen ligase family protein [Synechococcus sp. ATX 2A4]MCP9885705.1 O-antigen ligase family protein [Synechococcus sp. ATX 2A4]